MKKLTKEMATKEEIEVIDDWLDYYGCKKIRDVFYGNIAGESYLNKAKTIDGMFEKYDSFLDKSEPIYRGIRFKKGFDDNRYKMFIKNIHITKESDVLVVKINEEQK